MDAQRSAVLSRLAAQYPGRSSVRTENERHHHLDRLTHLVRTAEGPSDLKIALFALALHAVAWLEEIEA